MVTNVGGLWASEVEPGHQNKLLIEIITPHALDPLVKDGKAPEEDLNQRFLALRSPTVRSHCATNLTAQSHMGLKHSSAWSVEETINPSSPLLL